MLFFGYGRKEVYTRKPKKVFKAYKDEFGDKTYKLDKSYTGEEHYDSPLEEYDRQSQKRQRERLLKIVVFALIVVVGVVLMVAGIWNRIQ